MAAPANATRFFGTFNFMNPPETGQSVRYTVSLSALRFFQPLGTACA